LVSSRRELVPNTTAYLALLAWPILSLLFTSRRDPARALTLIVVGGYLFLPEKTSFDAPLVPPIGKSEIIAISALLVLGFRRPSDFKWLPGGALFQLLFFVYILSPILTVFTNGERLVYGPFVIKGLVLYDILGVMVERVAQVTPLILAFNYLKTREARLTFLRFFVILGLVYAPLILFELRMSPQLHTWIYGFFPHAFMQQIRADGFRAVVFLGHGLRVSFFIFTVFAASMILYRHKVRFLPVPTVVLPIFFFVLLYLNKSLGSFTYGLVFAAIVLLTNDRRRVFIAAMFASIILTYPLLRGADLVPTGTLLSWAEAVNPDRAKSLETRFDNEDLLLAKASEKMIFGWGGWGRSRVYSSETGEDISITDGAWVIAIGSYGWIGYLSMFGLLFSSAIFIWQRSRRSGGAIDPEISGLVLMLAFIGIELLPNSTLTPVSWLIAGTCIAAVQARKRAYVSNRSAVEV